MAALADAAERGDQDGFASALALPAAHISWTLGKPRCSFAQRRRRSRRRRRRKEGRSHVSGFDSHREKRARGSSSSQSSRVGVVDRYIHAREYTPRRQQRLVTAHVPTVATRQACYSVHARTAIRATVALVVVDPRTPRSNAREICGMMSQDSGRSATGASRARAPAVRVRGGRLVGVALARFATRRGVGRMTMTSRATSARRLRPRPRRRSRARLRRWTPRRISAAARVRVQRYSTRVAPEGGAHSPTAPTGGRRLTRARADGPRASVRARDRPADAHAPRAAGPPPDPAARGARALPVVRASGRGPSARPRASRGTPPRRPPRRPRRRPRRARRRPRTSPPRGRIGTTLATPPRATRIAGRARRLLARRARRFRLSQARARRRRVRPISGDGGFRRLLFVRRRAPLGKQALSGLRGVPHRPGSRRCYPRSLRTRRARRRRPRASFACAAMPSSNSGRRARRSACARAPTRPGRGDVTATSSPVRAGLARGDDHLPRDVRGRSGRPRGSGSVNSSASAAHDGGERRRGGSQVLNRNDIVPLKMPCTTRTSSPVARSVRRVDTTGRVPRLWCPRQPLRVALFRGGLASSKRTESPSWLSCWGSRRARRASAIPRTGWRRFGGGVVDDDAWPPADARGGFQRVHESAEVDRRYGAVDRVRVPILDALGDGRWAGRRGSPSAAGSGHARCQAGARVLACSSTAA